MILESGAMGNTVAFEGVGKVRSDLLALELGNRVDIVDHEGSFLGFGGKGKVR